MGFDSPRGLAAMTERKNIKIDASVYEELQEEKGEYETWNALFSRLVEE